MFKWTLEVKKPPILKRWCGRAQKYLVGNMDSRNMLEGAMFVL